MNNRIIDNEKKIDEILQSQNELWLSKHKFYRQYGKRLFDFVFSLIALIFLSVPMLLVAFLIWLDDHGSALFIQDRVGIGLKTFKIYKFRTMVLNAEEKGTKYTQKNDNRITKIGKFLRKTSIDELPQILNVLNGTMSFVGYRPTVLDLINWDDLNYLKSYCTKPGITGYAQVYGRSSNTYEETVMKNLKYLETASFWIDIKLIVLTAYKLFFPFDHKNQIN